MTARNHSFSIDEWYHCYNRGIDGRATFNDRRDYQRFLELLYLCNDNSPLRRDDYETLRTDEILELPRAEELVSIGAFCIMPNHFHLVLKEVVEGGTTSFMRKLGTSYALYFNIRHERIGNLFLKPFRSRHVATDRYFQHLINYVHCNPAVLYEPDWKSGNTVDPQFLGEQLMAYPYSSLSAFSNASAQNRPILNTEVLSIVRPTSISKMLLEARTYYSESGIPQDL